MLDETQESDQQANLFQCKCGEVHEHGGKLACVQRRGYNSFGTQFTAQKISSEWIICINGLLLKINYAQGLPAFNYYHSCARCIGGGIM